MHSFDKMKTYLTQCIGDWCESYLISWGTFQCYTILNFISGNFEDNWILDNRTLLCLDNEMESLTSISPISDETDCKSSSRAVTDLDGSEWEGSQLYIIVGNVGNLRLTFCPLTSPLGSLTGLPLLLRQSQQGHCQSQSFVPTS